MKLPTFDGISEALSRTEDRIAEAQGRGDVQRMCRLIRSRKRLIMVWREVCDNAGIV